MEAITTNIDKRVYKELYKKTIIFEAISIALGIILLTSCIIIGIINNNWSNALMIIYLALSIVLILVSLFYLFKIVNAINMFTKDNLLYTVNFQDEYMSTKVVRGEEVIRESKILYEEVLGYKETPNYIFLKTKAGLVTLQKEEGLMDFVNQKGFIRTRF